MEYRGYDTIAQEEAGNNKLFIDVRLIINILVDRMREQEMMARTWMRMVKCAQEVEGGDLHAVFRCIVQDGGIIKLEEGVLDSRDGLHEGGEGGGGHDAMWTRY
jgi:hypothetical protein